VGSRGRMLKIAFQYGLGCIAGLGLLLCSVSLRAAERPEFVPGSRVLAKRADVQLFDGNRAIGIAPIGCGLDIIKVDGNWLWVGSGWVQAADVVSAKQAIAYFARLLERQRSTFALVCRAKAYSENGDHLAAIDDCSEALRQSAAYAPALVCRASAYLDLKHLELAVGDLDDAVRADPKSSGAYSLRGQAHLLQGKYDLAAIDLETAARLDPKSCATWARLGTVHSRQARFGEALSEFNTALRLNPFYTVALNNRANVWFKRKEFRRA